MCKTHGLETVCREPPTRQCRFWAVGPTCRAGPSNGCSGMLVLNVLEEGTPSIQRLVTARGLLAGDLPWKFPW